MRLKYKVFSLLAAAVLAAGCHGTDPADSGNILNYSELLSLSSADSSFICATVMNPWKEGRVLHSYLLCNDNMPDGASRDARSIVQLPLKRAIVMNNSHCRLLSELGVASAIAGVCESEYISDSVISAAIADGSISDCGNSMYPNIEKIIELNPDAILLSPFENSGYGQLENLGIPLIECADYMETSPLAQAEWMRFYGLLFGVGDRADSLFESVSSDYISLRDSATVCDSKPKVMLDTRMGAAWYMAGGCSTIGQMIADAGGDYVLADDTHKGSIPLSFESVYEKASDSDIWLLKNSVTNNLTYSVLAQDFQSYTHFKPYQTRSIWVCDVFETPYFEITPFHPELLLKDFAAMFHAGDADKVRFYHPMRE